MIDTKGYITLFRKGMRKNSKNENIKMDRLILCCKYVVHLSLCGCGPMEYKIREFCPTWKVRPNSNVTYTDFRVKNIQN